MFSLKNKLLKNIFLSLLIIAGFLVMQLCSEYSCVFLASTYIPGIIKELMQYCILFLFVMLLVWLFIKYIDRLPFTVIGFQLKGHFGEIAKSFVLGLIVIGSGTLVLVLTDQIRLTPNTFHWLYFTIMPIIMLLVAMIEEMVMRGYVLRTLMKSSNLWIALCISSALFSLLHIPNIVSGGHSCFPLLSIFFAGILLGLVYIRTQNIWSPIALHFSWNFFQGFIFAYNVSGEEFYSILQQQRMENNIWNGGDFGFEGSVLCVFIVIVLCMFFLPKKS